MKKWTFNILILFLVLNTATTFAQVEKTKKVSKSYTVSNTTALNIDNKYGKVHINTNNGNTIKVDVTMVGRSSSGERAQDILDNLKVDVVEGNEISFRSGIISSIRSSRRWKRKGARSFEINYLISMPKNIKLKVKNKFGSVFLGDYTGELDLYVAYGSIKAGKITNVEDKKIKVAFGSADIDQVEQGDLTIAYGSLKLDNGKKLLVKNSFSTMEIRDIHDLDITSKYGTVSITKVNNLSGSSSFDTFKIGELNNNCTLKLKYAKGFEVSRVNKNFKKIDIDGQFSAMELRFDEGASFDYEVNTKFGKLKAALRQKMKIRKQIEQTNSNYYEGKYGQGNAKSKVTIKSKYGSVRIK
ncbi:hypothetical protein [uncultured Microscilla sp.]|uniref:hypothetical protein n=1 Tax=uncultured Microscilla sp. TaxID=432653 RepID=UPI00261F4815|nr:hypothetical protein [uncultured Microscilla sp.]